ncbi:MAG: uroporphyrinogen-III synthase [Ginsengibacter sp.]
MQNKIQILSTRPVGEALINKAALNNIIIDEFSFIKTEEIIDRETAEKIRELSHQKITAVFTSMNGVTAVEKLLSFKPLWKIFCIGNTTKKLVEKIFGEANISGDAENANLLAEKIIADSSIKKIIFFCGDQRREELPAKLKKNKIDIEEFTVYKTIETPQVLSKQYDGILFFSPSAVKSFFKKNSIDNNTKSFAIGFTTANALKLFIQQPVIIAEKPGKENLINLAIEHFSKTKVF